MAVSVAVNVPRKVAEGSVRHLVKVAAVLPLAEVDHARAMHHASRTVRSHSVVSKLKVVRRFARCSLPDDAKCARFGLPVTSTQPT